VLKVTSHSYAARQIRPSVTLYSFQPIITKLGAINHVGDPYSEANFSGIWLDGEFPVNKGNITFSWQCHHYHRY